MGHKDAVMFKKIIVATLSASAVMGFFAFGMSGCANDRPDSLLTYNNRNAANNSEFMSSPAPTPPQVLATVAQNGNVSAFNMESQGNQFTAKPSQRIKATAAYIYNCTNCKSEMNNQILVGLAGRSAQACIFNGGSHADGVADFLLKAPAKQGTYDVRFRFAQATNCEDALKNWWNLGNSPAKDSTIGQIIVR